MSEVTANQPKTTSAAFDYFVLSFCILVPTLGTLVLLALLDHLVGHEHVALGVIGFVYLSSVILGLYVSHHRDFWCLI